MRIPRRALPALVALALVSGACGDNGPSAAPSSAAPSATPAPTESVTAVPFAPATFPTTGSACGADGYDGRLGRIEAVNERTVRFTLCAPDGAFPTRLAHPALSILDASEVALLAKDRSAASELNGTGPYSIERWVAGENVILRRRSEDAGGVAAAPMVILRWSTDAAARTSELKDATVDGIDAPGPAELDEIATLPELVVTARRGLATAFLAFGSGPAFAGAAVRRAIAGAIDRNALTGVAFPAGSVVPTHLVPCIVDGACGGKAWYPFNAPAAAAVLAEAGFDLGRRYPLHVPDEAVPGLPDPAAAAEAVRAQLEANLGMKVSIDRMPLDAFRKAVRAGSLNGLYLDGVASSLPDATGLLEPLFGPGVRTTPARRAGTVSGAVAQASATANPKARTAAIARANTAIRSTAVIVPLAHPGSVVVYRNDVTGVTTSPLGLDPLGAAVPGDRPQLVFMQRSEPDGAWCGDQPSLDAYRLCGLVFEGLYGFEPGALAPKPRLAQGCEAERKATIWTCTLRPDVTFANGATLDAVDVLATFVAQWDARAPLRSGGAKGSFAAWDELFGGPLNGG